MLPPRSGYHRHSSKYKKALLQLQSKYASVKEVKEKHKLLDDFNHKTYHGYSAIGRLKGLAELRGLEMGVKRSLVK